jgi:2-C-methyl-D-erythritol 2,4-cyclodiphosphate synthase
MQANLARILAVSPQQINIKATTTEGLGIVGKGAGIAAMAIVLLRE